MNEDRKKELVMKAVDGLATNEEQAELERYLREDRSLAQEYQSFKRIKEVTDSIMFKELPDSYWAGYWADLYNRLERGTGWVLFSIGAIILIAFGVYQLLIGFFLSAKIPLVLKIGVAAGIMGLIILIISIIREVLFAHKKERYKEVQL